MYDKIINLLETKLYSTSEELNDIFASDFDLNPNAFASKVPPLPAAVLIPIIKRQDEIYVILTRRSLELKVHSGQIAFPGGRYDEGDGNLVNTALREAFEEIGLEPQYVKPIAKGGNYLSGTNYIISPIIGLVHENANFKANRDEVDEIFEIPFNYLFDKKNHEIRNYMIAGVERYFYAINYQKYFVWGVTAGLISSLCNMLGEIYEN